MNGNKVITISRTRKYSGYQFYAQIRMDRESSDRGLLYLILYIEKWITERTGEDIDSQSYKHIPENFSKLSADDFISRHITEGFSLNITSLVQSGKWAASLREQDSPVPGRDVVNGRFFETEIGLSVLDEEWLGLAIQINLIDPEGASELSFAFRPKFVGEIFRDPCLEIRNIVNLPYDKAIQVRKQADAISLKKVAFSKENRMPTVIFCESAVDLDIVNILSEVDSHISNDEPENLSSLYSRYFAEKEQPIIKSYRMLYDADEFAKHSFGYARVYMINHTAFDFLHTLLPYSIQSGDVLIIEPPCYGGGKTIYREEEYPSIRDRQKLADNILDFVHCYSKKNEYDFGSIEFEQHLRIAERRKQLEDISKEIQNEKEKEIYSLAESLVSAAEAETKNAKAECSDLKKENYNLQQQLLSLTDKSNCNTLSQEEKVISLSCGNIEELYTGELHDLVVTMLNSSPHLFMEGSRPNDLLLELIRNNVYIGEGRDKFKKLKKILSGKSQITSSDIQAIEELGFAVEKLSSGHYRINIVGDNIHTATLAGTASDWRGQKNSFSILMQGISVYKNNWDE